MENKKINKLSSSHENYIRMLALFIPYLDYSFFYDNEIKEEKLKNKLLLSMQRYGNFGNLDLMKSILDFYYPKEEYDFNYFYERLKEISKDLLTYHDNRMCIDMFDSYKKQTFTSFFNNKVLDYLEVNKLVSNSMLMAFYNVCFGYDIKYCLERHLIQPISVVNHQLNIVLSKGIAETHTHIVGSIPFERQWNWLSHEIYDQNRDAEKLLNELENIDGVQSQKERYGYRDSLSLLIKATLILRLMMMSFLLKNKEWENSFDFEKFIERIGRELRIQHSLNVLFKFILNENSNENLNDELDNIIQSLKDDFYLNEFDNDDDTFSKKLYKNLILVCVYNGIDKEKVENLNINEYIEYIFQHLSIVFIENNQKDYIFKKSFLFYIRVKNFIHSFIVQSTDIKGFLEFQTFFSKQGAVYDVPKNMFKNIFQTYLYENVHYLEVRIGHVQFQRSGNKNQPNLIKQKEDLQVIYYKTLLNFVKSYKQYLTSLPDSYRGNIAQVGLILHFNKRYEKVDKCWKEYYQYDDNTMIRYKEYQRECFLNLLVYQNLRDEIPYMEDYLIGLDTASNELLTEPWVFAPIFRSVKDKYSNTLQEMGKEYGIKTKNRRNVGVTYHVGEVFYSIGSGLRHVDEVIEYFGFQNGERLGHATVLGIEIEEYISNRNIETLPAIELLDNLLWFYHLKSTDNLFKNISISYLEEKIWDIIHFIYDDENGNLIGSISLHHIYMSYRKQFDSLSILKDFRDGCQYECNSNYCKNACIFKKENKDIDENLLLLSRHCNYFLKKMMRKVQININDDIIKSIYQEAQNYLIKKIAKKGIIIETNPVSNVNIGEVSGMGMHPIIKFNNSFKEDYNRIMVSINTDDPGVFSTTLKNQYGYILEILMKQGIPMEKALLWIDQVRENGMNSTFINQVKSREQLMKELSIIEDKIEEVHRG